MFQSLNPKPKTRIISTLTSTLRKGTIPKLLHIPLRALPKGWEEKNPCPLNPTGQQSQELFYETPRNPILITNATNISQIPWTPT